jgi:hypothetical protein
MSVRQGQYSNPQTITGNRQEPVTPRHVVLRQPQRRSEMSEFRNPRDPFYRDLNDPAYGTGYERAAGRTNNWGWIAAAAVSLAVVFVIAFTAGHEPKRIATGDTTRLAATRMAPPPMAFSPPAPASVPAPDPNRP